MSFPVPANEEARLQALHDYSVLDTPPEAAFERITHLAARLFRVPMSTVTLVDRDRQWFKSCYGLDDQQTGRDVSFCAHAIVADTVMVVPDARADARFADNPSVTGPPHICFYAGAPLRTASGFNLGTLCVIDTEPRAFSDAERETLTCLAAVVVDELELRLAEQKMQADIAERRRVEAELRESEALFHRFLDNNPAVAFIKDDKGRYTYVNQPMERLFDVRLDDLRGKTDFDWLPPETAAQLREHDRAVLASGQATEMVEAVPTPDGQIHHWLSFKFPVQAASGQPMVGGVAVDITERTRAEAALRASEERLQDFFDNASDLIQSIAPDGRIRYVNRAWREKLGYGEEEIAAGLNIFDILHPASHAHCAEYFQRVLQGEAVGSVEAVFVTKDDREIIVEGSVTCRFENRRPVATRGIFRDVTENRRAQQMQARQARQTALRADVGAQLAVGDSLPDVLQRCAEIMAEHLDAAFLRIWTLDEYENVLELQASAGLYTHRDGAHSRVPVGQWKIGKIAQERKPHLTNNVLSDARVSDKEWAKREGMVAFAGYPLIAGNRVQGVLGLFSRHPLNQDTLDTIGAVAEVVTQGIERRRTEAALKEGEARKAAILEAAMDSIITINADGRVLEFNPAAERTFGYRRADVLGRDVADLIIPPAEREDFRHGLSTAFGEGKAMVGRRAEIVSQRADGTQFPAEITTTRIAGDGPPLFTGYLRDISESKRLEEALRQSEEKFRSLIENGSDVITILEADGLIRYESPSVRRVLGYEPDEMIGRNAFEFVHPDDAPMVIAAFQQAAGKAGIGQSVEFRFRHRDGSWRTLEALGNNLLHDPAVGGIIVNSRDITARKRAEERLRLLESVVVNANDAILITEAEPVDLPGPRILYVNDAFTRMTGYTLEEVIGKTPRLFQGPNTARAPREKIRAALKAWKPVVVELINYHKDGTEFWVELSIVPVADETGWYTHWVSIQRDITERKRAEEALRESETRKAAILETALDCIITMDHEGRVREFNPAAERTFGYSRADVLGRELADLIIPPALRPAHREGLARYLATGEGPVLGRRIELPAVRAGGAEITVELAITRIPVDGPPQFTAHLRDITERKRTDEALRQAKEEAEWANQAKSEFLSRMSHELRTPLNAILGFSQLLEMDPLEPDQSESVEHIVKAGRHLLDLINEVLDIARIETGRLSLSPEPVLLSEALGEALDLVRPLARRRRLALQQAAADIAGRYVLADRQRLKQVLLNLLSNAVKYNRDGGQITISSCEAPDHRLCIRITDTGFGIAPDQMANLFVPFERLGAERTDIEGTGIGLALSKRLVEAMDGTLRVESVVGQGTTLFLTLPLAQDPWEHLPEAGEPFSDEEALCGRACTVLYIEDNLSNLRLIERILAQRPEIRLIAAQQGGLGLELAREHHPDLILLDLHLPDIGGEEVLRRLREDDVTRALPVAVVSADATPGQVRRLTEAGAAAYLTKPFDVKALLAFLDESLAAEN